MTDPKLLAAAGLMGKALAGIALNGDVDEEYGADFEIDAENNRVWAELILKSGDVYEISTRWVEEKSP